MPQVDVHLTTLLRDGFENGFGLLLVCELGHSFAGRVRRDLHRVKDDLRRSTVGEIGFQQSSLPIPLVGGVRPEDALGVGEEESSDLVRSLVEKEVAETVGDEGAAVILDAVERVRTVADNEVRPGVDGGVSYHRSSRVHIGGAVHSEMTVHGDHHIIGLLLGYSDRLEQHL